MNTKKLGLPSVIATGVGLIVATSCLMSLGQGAGAVGISFIIAMLLACAINIITALSLAELNALMPDLTGGLAQYTLASLGPFVTIITMVGGYLVCNTIAGSVECAMFGNTMVTVFGGKIPSSVYCVVLLLLLIAANLNGIDMFAKIQDIVAYGLIGSVVLMGLIGALRLGTGRVVHQPLVLTSDPKTVFSMVGLAFFLFLGCEFVIPISKNVKNARKTIPLGMILSLLIVCGMEILVVLGMHNYTDWSALASSASPHIYYGVHLLGNAIFMHRNKKGAPHVGILLIGGAMVLINATGLSNTSQLSNLILIGCFFWMAAYAISNLNVLIFRARLPKAPRTFRVPLGPILPLVGIAGNVFMMCNISSDPSARAMIYRVVLLTFICLAVYAAIWTKHVMHLPLFKPIRIEHVMAMENEMYGRVRRRMNKQRKEAVATAQAE